VLGSADAHHSTILNDVSESGVGLLATAGVAPGARLHVVAGVPGRSGVLSGDVEVRWCTESGQAEFLVGAEFVGPPRGREALLAK